MVPKQDSGFREVGLGMVHGRCSVKFVWGADSLS